MRVGPKTQKKLHIIYKGTILYTSRVVIKKSGLLSHYNDFYQKTRPKWLKSAKISPKSPFWFCTIRNGKFHAHFLGQKCPVGPLFWATPDFLQLNFSSCSQFVHIWPTFLSHWPIFVPQSGPQNAAKTPQNINNSHTNTSAFASKVPFFERLFDHLSAQICFLDRYFCTLYLRNLLQQNLQSSRQSPYLSVP